MPPPRFPPVLGHLRGRCGFPVSLGFDISKIILQDNLDRMARPAVAWLPLDAKTMATDGQKSHRG